MGSKISLQAQTQSQTRQQKQAQSSAGFCKQTALRPRCSALRQASHIKKTLSLYSWPLWHGWVLCKPCLQAFEFAGTLSLTVKACYHYDAALLFCRHVPMRQHSCAAMLQRIFKPCAPTLSEQAAGLNAISEVDFAWVRPEPLTYMSRDLPALLSLGPCSGQSHASHTHLPCRMVIRGSRPHDTARWSCFGIASPIGPAD